MSLVGPRPPIPHEVEQYTPYQMQRLLVRPGLTCIWQVSGRNNIGFDEWVEMDIEYIKNRSLFLDIKLIFKTVGVLFGDDNASFYLEMIMHHRRRYLNEEGNVYIISRRTFNRVDAVKITT